MLAPGGRLRLSVPDFDKTLEGYGLSRDPVLLRHMLGPRNSTRGFHLLGYGKESLRRCVEAEGYEFVGEEENIHAYPALCFVWRKPQC